MKNKLFAIFTISVFLLASFAASPSLGTKAGNIFRLTKSKELVKTTFKLNGETLLVDDDNTLGPWNGTEEYPYQYIRDAIDNASNDDTVFVYNGTYYENIIINKIINLVGEDRNITVIDGIDGENIIHVIIDGVSIANFVIRNSGGEMDNAGVKIDSNNSSITRCSIYRTKTGIYANETRSNIMENCSFYTNGEGIFLKNSSENIIVDCCFYHNAIGVNFKNAKQNLISKCDMHTNGIAIYFEDSSNNEISSCNIYDNNDNQGGIFLVNCQNINISRCVVCHNGHGIRFISSSNSSVFKCRIHWNEQNGIFLRDESSCITVSYCEICNNFRVGILFQGSSTNNQIFYNNIYNNKLYGIKAGSTTSSCARHNWWGSLTGPSGRACGFGDKLIWKGGHIFYFPWLLRPINLPELHCKTDSSCQKEFMDINTIYCYPNSCERDTDNDGCPDWWEEKWGYDPLVWDDHGRLDPDNDGLNNIEEYLSDQWDSNPFHRDVFLEIDWMETKNPDDPPYKIPELGKQKMIDAFAKQNITLHIDDGSLGGGEKIPYIERFFYTELRDLYWKYFLHNDMNNIRKGIFHYGLFCPSGPSSGFAFVGWNQLDSFVTSLVGENEIAGASMHELGHSFGLFIDDFGGIDNFDSGVPWKRGYRQYKNYKSCLNYRYTYNIIDYSDGTHGKGDFDDWDNIDLSFFKNSHWEWPKE